MPNPRRIILKNLTFEELESFYNGLNTEKKYVSNPLHSTLDFVVGVRQNGELVGVGGLKRYFGIFYFSFVIVKTEFQRKGFSSIIISETLKYSRSKSYPIIFASSNKQNTASFKAHHKMGYKTIYESNSYYRLGVPFNPMGLVIIKIMPVFFGFYLLINKILGRKGKT